MGKQRGTAAAGRPQGGASFETDDRVDAAGGCVRAPGKTRSALGQTPCEWLSPCAPPFSAARATGRRRQSLSSAGWQGRKSGQRCRLNGSIWRMLSMARFGQAGGRWEAQCQETRSPASPPGCAWTPSPASPPPGVPTPRPLVPGARQSVGGWGGGGQGGHNRTRSTPARHPRRHSACCDHRRGWMQCRK